MSADGLADRLGELVRIPSMNPMGRGVTGPEYSEAALAAYVAEDLRRIGLDPEVDEVEPGRPNVSARFNVRAPETLLLEAHLDTVHAGRMTVPPFDPAVRGGRLYGRGSCDTKASLAAFLEVLRAATDHPRRARCNILFAAVADEEYRFMGARRLVTPGLRADFGIVGEPTRLEIIRAHKGVTRWRIVTHGVAAHSAYPGRGDNAIYRMAAVVERLADYADELSAQTPHPLLGSPSLSVGVIEGGQAVNVVPDRCWIEIDRRSLPGETAESIIGPVRRALREVPQWEIEGPHLSVNGMEVAADAPIVCRLAEAVRAVKGDAAIGAAHYATDAGIYGAAGVPTVVFGPGDIAQAHAAEEYVELDQVRQAVAILERLVL